MQRQILHSGLLDQDSMVPKIDEKKDKIITCLMTLKKWAEIVEAAASHRLGFNAILTSQFVPLN